MKASATITRKNVGDAKEEYSLSYSVKESKTEAKLLKIKEDFDKIIVKAGGQTTLDDVEE